MMHPGYNWTGELLINARWWTDTDMDSAAFAYWLGRFEPIEDET